MERLKRRHILNIGSLLHQSLGAKYLSLFVPAFSFFLCASCLVYLLRKKTQSTFFFLLYKFPSEFLLISFQKKKEPLINISCVRIRKHVYIDLLFSFVYQLQVDGLSLFLVCLQQGLFSLFSRNPLYGIYIYAYSEKSMAPSFLIIMDDVPCFLP